MSQRTMIAVIGSGGQVSDRGVALAEEVGRLIAERGAALVCGGRGGIMEAAARGCRSGGGDVVGILPGDSADSANPFVSIPIVTAMGHARNVIIAQTARALIAIEGEYGTLSEIAIALKLKKTVVLLHSDLQVDGTARADDAVEAVNMIFNAIEGGTDDVKSCRYSGSNF